MEDFLEDFIMYEMMFPSTVNADCPLCGCNLEVETNDQSEIDCICPNCNEQITILT